MTAGAPRRGLADPESGLSFVFLTNGAHKDALRQGANGFKLSTLADRPALGDDHTRHRWATYGGDTTG